MSRCLTGSGTLGQPDLGLQYKYIQTGLIQCYIITKNLSSFPEVYKTTSPSVPRHRNPLTVNHNRWTESWDNPPNHQISGHVPAHISAHFALKHPQKHLTAHFTPETTHRTGTIPKTNSFSTGPINTEKVRTNRESWDTQQYYVSQNRGQSPKIRGSKSQDLTATNRVLTFRYLTCHKQPAALVGRPNQSRKDVP